MSDVLVVLPGIMGSVLQKDGRDVWALSGAALLSGLRDLDKHLDLLKLSDDSPDADDLGDGIKAVRLFPDTHLLPGFWKVDGYTKMLRRISDAFDLRPGQNFFEFPYDWRRDNRAAAQRLARESHGWLRAWQEQSGNRDAKLLLVAHSMGGLVARHFLECLEGWRDTRRLITFGTPYRGSLNAVNVLSNGLKKSLGPVQLVDLSALLRSFTSLYQLLPIYPCYDNGDGKLARIAEVSGIQNIDAAKAAGALIFHRDIEAAVNQHLKLPDYAKAGYKIHPIVGTYQDTYQIARRGVDRVEMQSAYPGRNWEGDGTVPEVSAVPIELSDLDREFYVAQTHGSLQNSGVVLDHVVKLLGKEEIGPEVRGDEARIGLTLEEVYETGEPVRIRGRCDDEDASLAVVVQSVADNAIVARADSKSRSREMGLYEVNLAPLAEGVYRVTVSGGGAVPVSDLCVVAGTR